MLAPARCAHAHSIALHKHNAASFVMESKDNSSMVIVARSVNARASYSDSTLSRTRAARLFTHNRAPQRLRNIGMALSASLLRAARSMRAISAGIEQKKT